MITRFVGVVTTAWGVVLLLAPGALGFGIPIGIALISLGAVIVVHPQGQAVPWLVAPVAVWWVVSLVAADGPGEAALAVAMVALYVAAAMASRRPTAVPST